MAGPKRLIAGDEGKDITVTVRDGTEIADSVVDLTDYTGVEFEVRRPHPTDEGDTEDVAWTASFVSPRTSGKVRYTTASGDLPRAGTYILCVKLTKSGAVHRSRAVAVQVFDKFSVP